MVKPKTLQSAADSIWCFVLLSSLMLGRAWLVSDRRRLDLDLDLVQVPLITTPY